MINRGFLTNLWLHLLVFATPLIFLPFTAELFEFNKMLYVYLITGLLLLTLARPHFELTLPSKFIVIGLGLFILVILASTITSIHPYTSIFGYYSRFHGGLLSYFIFSLLFFIILNQTQKQPNLKYSLLSTFVISIVIVSIYGILQHFGIDDHIWKQDVKNRIFSTMGQPNWLALVVIAALPWTWSLSLTSKKDYPPIIFQIISLISQLILVWCLLYTKSRSGFIALMIMIGIYWFFIIVKNFISLKRIFPGIIVSVLALGLPILLSGSPYTKPLFEQQQITSESLSPNYSDPGGTESFAIRQIVWKGAINLGQKYPLFGTGPETFAYSYFWERPPEQNYVSEWDFIYNKAHNEFLNFYATTGLTGLISYSLVLISISIILLITVIKSSPQSILIPLSGLVVIIGLSISHSAGFSVVASNLYLFILAALSLSNLPTTTIKVPRIISKTLFVFSIIFGMGLIIFVSRIFLADTRYASAKSLYEKGYLEEPEMLITQAINFYPYELNYHNLASKIYSDQALEKAIADQVDTAYDYYSKTIYSSNAVIKSNPYSTIYLADRANVLSQLQPFDEQMLPAAILSLDRQVQLAPTDPRPLYNLAILNARIKNFELTFDYLNKALELKNDYHDARRAIALYHYQQAYDDEKKLTSPDHLKEAIDAVKSHPESFPANDWTPILNAWQTEYTSASK